MDNKQFKDQWSTICPMIKQKWNKFSDQELNQIKGDKSLFLNHLQKKYSLDRTTAEKELDMITSSSGQVSHQTQHQQKSQIKQGPQTQQSQQQQQQQHKGKQARS